MSTTCNLTPASNIGANNSATNNPSIGLPPACNGANPLYQGADVWFTTTVPASGLIGIYTEESSICAGAFQLYTATACNGTFTSLPGNCSMVGLTGPTSEPAIIFNAAGS